MIDSDYSRTSTPLVRTVQDGSASAIVVDLVDHGESVSVDVVDGTAIVVMDDDQYEIELPADATDAHTFIRNGVLTIELEDSR